MLLIGDLYVNNYRYESHFTAFRSQKLNTKTRGFHEDQM